jgi:hypothetical protein
MTVVANEKHPRVNYWRALLEAPQAATTSQCRPSLRERQLGIDRPRVCRGTGTLRGFWGQEINLRKPAIAPWIKEHDKDW